MTFTQALLFGTGLLALINPPSVLPTYTEIVASYDLKTQRRIAIRTMFAIAAFMLIVLWLGQHILQYLDIQIGALQAAGGLIILRVGIRQVDANDRKMPEDELEKTESEAWNIVAVVPLAIPLTVGGGTIALLVATAAQSSGSIETLTLSVVCLFVSLIIGVIYYFASAIREFIGPIIMRIMVRIGGIILIAIAMQLLTTGLLTLLPGLA